MAFRPQGFTDPCWQLVRKEGVERLLGKTLASLRDYVAQGSREAAQKARERPGSRRDKAE